MILLSLKFTINDKKTHLNLKFLLSKHIFCKTKLNKKKWIKLHIKRVRNTMLINNKLHSKEFQNIAYTKFYFCIVLYYILNQISKSYLISQTKPQKYILWCFAYSVIKFCIRWHLENLCATIFNYQLMFYMYNKLASCFL